MQNLSYENEFDMHEMNLKAEHISIRMVLHKTRFDTEAQGQKKPPLQQ